MAAGMEVIKQGAEARIYLMNFLSRPTIVKERFTKAYRHPTLDQKLTHKRTSQEARSLLRCRKAGIATPAVFFVDYESHKIYMENIVDSQMLKDRIDYLLKKGGDEAEEDLKNLARQIGATVAAMHNVDCIHGDLTTSNLLLKEGGPIFVIDFGLSFISALAEDKGVDLYVLERAFLSSHPNTENIFKVVLDSYKTACNQAGVVLAKFEDVRQRGRKRLMVG